MGTIVALCVSSEKGTQKKEVESVVLREEHGIEGDAHAGPGHRQISLLSYESIKAFKEKGAEVDHGSFGENLIVSGIDLNTLPVGTRFSCNDAVLELTQIGKECHSRCQIYHTMGDCIMPREGVFVRVLSGGSIKPGDVLQVL